MKFLAAVKTMMSVGLMGLILVGAAHAAEYGTAAEAEAMVKKAVAYIKANGPDRAYEEFTNGKSFKDRDLYVFAYDMTGKNLAHGANAKLVGKDLSGLRDPEGKMIVQMVLDTAKTKGKGWTGEFKFRNPVTEKLEPKIVYVERAGDTVIGAGIYRQ